MPTIPTAMTAWSQSDYGGPDVVVQTELPVPRPGAGEVLLRVDVCALNAGDVRLMRGDPRIVRLAFGVRRPKHAVRGMDVAGRIVAVGEGVDPTRIGADVVVELPGGGGLAPYAVAPADRVVRRPASVSPDDAACLPIAAGTAEQALRLGAVEAGQRVLIVGASGGVGTFAVQLAALRGADVHALCGAAARPLVEGLGATRTWDYRAAGIDMLPDEYDAIIDIAGTTPLRALRRRLVPGGVLVMVAGTGGPVLGPLPRMLRAAVLSIGSRSLRPLAAKAEPETLAMLLEHVASGSIRAVIEQRHPRSDAGVALRRQDSGRVVGKVVVHIGT